MLLLGAVFIIMYSGFMAIKVWRYLRAARAAAHTTRPYNRDVPAANQHLLVIGDSTMYGVGVKDPVHTVGGLLTAKHPAASVETLAINGAKVADVTTQLKQAVHQHYHLIIIGAGGNDIVQFSSYRRLRRDLRIVLHQASQLADQVVLCHSVNLGNIGFFIFPLNYLFDYRSRRLSQIYAQVAAEFPSVTYVNFYRPMHDDHYDKHSRAAFIAGDAFHPNDYANQYFFDLIWQALKS